MFLYIVRKELEKTFAKVTNKFQIDASILTTTLVGAGKKVLRKIFNKWSNWARKYSEISVLPAKGTYSYIFIKPISEKSLILGEPMSLWKTPTLLFSLKRVKQTSFEKKVGFTSLS